MADFCDYKDPYALVRFYGDYGYGHMVATVFNAVPEAYRCPKIVISCQVGHGNDFSDKDTMFEKPYAERWGIEGRDSDITTLQDMELMIPLMRRINRRLDKLSVEMGYPRSYADFMFRILTSMKLNRVVYIESYGGRWSGNTEDLPHVEMGNSWPNNDLIKQLEKMQDDLCGRFKRPIGEAA